MTKRLKGFERERLKQQSVYSLTKPRGKGEAARFEQVRTAHRVLCGSAEGEIFRPKGARLMNLDQGKARLPRNFPGSVVEEVKDRVD